MTHNRKLVIGGVALVKARLKGTGAVMVSICDELEPMLIESGFIAEAPFGFVNLIIRYGLKDQWVPEYQKINERYGDLPVTIEVDVSGLVGASVHAIRAKFRAATLEALIQVATKYALPAQPLIAARERAKGGG